MKKEFSWYFPISEQDLDGVWDKCLLTVDANVLLDLYRYHDSTRNTLINSLKEFKGRLWISNQAAEEFIKNRNNVIVSSEKTFRQAKEEVEKLKSSFESTISQLKGNRIIPEDIANSLIEKINPAVDEALEKIIESKSSYPKYLKADPILEELMEMFEDSVGDRFPEEETPNLIKEAENRKKNKVPPGYMDGDKDGERPYGDFFLWKQILLKSKNDNVPVIFVTSERKEDWWEKISGKTIGPRPELLREAFEFSNQRVLIYQTDRFLEFSSKRSGSVLDANAVDEIRAIDSLRSDAEHAVEIVEHNLIDATEALQEGILVLNLMRPVKNLTGSGSFVPHMRSIPALEVSLVSAPDELGSYKLRAGAGTKYNFNLHVITSDRDQLLPIGQYTLKYKAICEPISASINTVKQLADAVGVAPERLLKQLIDAGIEAKNEHDEISNSQKAQLLQYLNSGRQ